MVDLIQGRYCVDPARVGNKAASLSHLHARGWAVPSWFVVPTDAFTVDGRVSPELEDKIMDAMVDMGGRTFAVRASPYDQHASEQAPAGKFLSELDVPSSEVMDAICRVHASGGRKSAVIVQRMLHPDASGTLFTVDPRTGDRSTMLVSAIHGLSDGVVTSVVNGWTWTIDRDSDEVIPVAASEGDAPLDHGRFSMLRSIGRAMDADMEMSPLEIEWAIVGTDIFMLQVRPITNLPPGHRRVFDSSDIGEIYPGVVSPLTFSFARKIYGRGYRQLLELLGVSPRQIAMRSDAFDALLARFDGHVYYDRIAQYRLLAALPEYCRNHQVMDRIMGIDKPLPEGAHLQHIEGEKAASTLRVVAGLITKAISFPWVKKAFLGRVEKMLREPIDLATADMDILVGQWRNIERQLLDRWDAPLLNEVFCAIAIESAQRAVQRWAGDDGNEMFDRFLISHSGGIPAQLTKRIIVLADHARDLGEDMIKALRTGNLAEIYDRFPEMGQGIDSCIVEFGDYCVGTMKFESRTLRDDPTPLLRAILGVIESGSALIIHGDDPRPVHPHEVFVGRSLRGGVVRLLLRLVTNRFHDQEKLQSERVRVFAYLRRIVRELGERLVAAGALEDIDDVFQLTVDELLGYVEGWGVDTDLRSIVTHRRQESEAWGNPQDRFETIGSPHVARWIQVRDLDEDDAEIRRGNLCSPGIYAGVARVVRHPFDAVISPGEVLVIRSADPGCVMLLAGVGAVVVEKGSMFSPLVTAAREMRIPCVTGIRGGVEWIEDGDQIEVDGLKGVVRKIRAA